MKILEQLLRKEIDKLIVEHIKDQKTILDLLITEYQDKRKKMVEEIDSMKTLFESLAKVYTVFDVEAVLDQVTEELRQRLIDEATRMAAAYGIKMKLGRDIVPLELPATLEVYGHCVYYLVGLKFIEGDGYGQYAIWDGAKVILRQTFTRSKSGGEIGMVFRPIRFEENEIFTIDTFMGKAAGKLSISLIGLSARPFTRLSAIGRITED